MAQPIQVCCQLISGTGDQTITLGSAVPAGEVWSLVYLSVVQRGAVAFEAQFLVDAGADDVPQHPPQKIVPSYGGYQHDPFAIVEGQQMKIKISATGSWLGAVTITGWKDAVS